MKIDFSQKIIGPQGEELDMDLAAVSLQALNAPEKNREIPLDEAVKRGTLALKVAGGGEHDITPEEAALIRNGLSRVWAPVVVARAAKMLE